MPRSKFLNGPFTRYGPVKLAYISLHSYVVKKICKMAKTQKSWFFMYIFVHVCLEIFSIKYEMVPYLIPKISYFNKLVQKFLWSELFEANYSSSPHNPWDVSTKKVFCLASNQNFIIIMDHYHHLLCYIFFYFTS